MIHRFAGARLASLILFLLFAFGQVAAAQPSDGPTPDPIAVLDAETSELAAINNTADENLTQEARAALRDRAIAVETRANEAVVQLTPQLGSIDSRIQELGEPSDNEAPDIKSQRGMLADERGNIDSAIKRGRLLAVDARQTTDKIILDITEAFNRDIFQNAPSPLSPTLWAEVARSFPGDRARILGFAADTTTALAEGLRGRGLLVATVSLGIAALLIVPVRRRLRHAGRRFAIDQAPNTRARRSGLGLWFVLVGTLTSTLAFVSILVGLRWSGAIPGQVETLALTMTIAASIGAFVISLGAGLLLVGQSSWRLLPISDEAARRLRPLPAWAAALTFVSVTLIEAGKIIGISQPATILTNYAVAFAYAALIVTVLITLRHIRRSEADEEEREPSASTTLVTVVTMLAWIIVGISLIAAFQGTVNFSLLLVRQAVWVAIVAATTFLLVVVADDLCTSLLSGESRLGRALHAGLGIRTNQVRQIGVILSAVLRIGLVFLAFVAVSVPFGPGADSFFYARGEASQLTIGGITVVPGAILKAIVIFVVGIALMRVVRHWINESFLPATDLDLGARNSVVTIVSYAGIILAGFWALTALGIGVERIALVVSALSVGIGFGLQAITQNFVSGLILLAERPVKIGDTVRIGTDEGDVKRISVRSTEIQIADRSTLIVPNSELITKTIRNMTLANPLGRIQIAFSAPIDVDVAAVRKALLDIYAEHPAVLDDPAPSVFLDGITGGQIGFNSFAFVSGPRAVYATRSALLFSMLERLREDGVPLVAPAPA